MTLSEFMTKGWAKLEAIGSKIEAFADNSAKIEEVEKNLSAVTGQLTDANTKLTEATDKLTKAEGDLKTKADALAKAEADLKTAQDALKAAQEKLSDPKAMDRVGAQMIAGAAGHPPVVEEKKQPEPAAGPGANLKGLAKVQAAFAAESARKKKN